LEERTKSFALRVLNLVEHLPDTIGGRIIANQLARSATLVAANYRAACRGRSRAEFASKLGTVAEESDERLYWLELIRDANFISGKRIASLVAEVDELTAIFTSGRRSASRSQMSNNQILAVNEAAERQQSNSKRQRSNFRSRPQTSNLKPQTS
jgi:four helix bundle protein